MEKNDLPDLERLSTKFFPSPVADHEEYKEHKKHRVVVVAYDHSHYGDAVIAKSIRLGLLRPTDDIRILHIVSQTDYRTLFDPMISAQSTSGGFNEENLDNTLSNVADAFIHEIINSLRKIGFTHVKSEVLRGDSKESITDYCRMAKPVFIITGTRGLGAIKKAVMGSVSSYLTRHCPCPVMVMKLEQSEIDARNDLNSQKDQTFADILASMTAQK
ncbi:uncharacterized protein EV154DRAFT_506445 [Mucor mucedo]|uniref:uncharacterized protein n=1 Tax=Mucor mucedo TaxID=29922 RepID=UPI00221FE697|nr:uncharacterized protein EV154DRAFT_506445 [Mucor mucedo]KAI7891944.1 hypothetical protein EV154DRAFT_506445 [Mucor mucedo]